MSREQSIARFRFDYEPALPIASHREELIAAIRENPVVIVAGSTGSGKSTQLPKLAIEAGRGRGGMIAHTQPRRIAARAIAQRLAEETHTKLGDEVGYAVRFDDRSSADTVVRLMTDGVLLNELGRDPKLSRYDTIIVDEAHERSLNIDFLLGVLTRLLSERDDLKVIITSATIDTDRFARHFASASGPAPVVVVEGRTFPVEIRFHDPSEEPFAASDLPEAIAAAVEELLDDQPGDVLVFCSGEREIRDAAEAVRARVANSVNRRPVEVLSLFARLSTAEQQRIFAGHRGRRVIVATNIAETSLTVPGVRAVVDTGLARISRYSQRTKVQRLPIEEVSQASAHQRSGRCGRLGPGICIRLYSEENFLARPEFTEPEILRTNLAAVTLQMAQLNLGRPDEFSFIDPPDQRQVAGGIALLEELRAVHPTEERPGKSPSPIVGTRRWLTHIGVKLSRLPIDPRLGAMLIEATERDLLEAVLPVAARLAIGDPRERPRDNLEAAASSHNRFEVPGSDFLGVLSLWAYLDDLRRDRSSSAFARRCRKEYLHYQRIREWQDLVGQLRAAVHAETSSRGRNGRQGTGGRQGSGGRQQQRQRGRTRTVSTAATSPTAAAGDRRRGGYDVRSVLGATERPGRTPLRDEFHKCLLAGLLSHVGMRDGERNEYRGTRNSRFLLGRSSAARGAKAPWIMAAELVETDRLWGQIAATIEVEWIDELGDHLVRRSFTDPRWDPTRGAAVVKERSSILGLPLAADRLRQLGAVDHDLARSYFLDHGLVRSEWGIEFPVLDDNRDVLATLEARAARARHVIEVDLDELLIDFYAEKLPERIDALVPFRKWWRQNPTERASLLSLDEAWILERLNRSEDAFDTNPLHFPQEWRHGTAAYPLTYAFAPGTDEDGVSVEIPVEDLHSVEPADFRWHVPGYRAWVVDAAVRALPKATRREMAPLGDTIDAILGRLDLESAIPSEPFDEALARVIRAECNIVIDRNDQLWPRIDPHLLIRFCVMEGPGRRLATGRDILALRSEFGHVAVSALHREHSEYARAGLTDWTFGDLPRRLTSLRSAANAAVFPGLLDRGDHVDVVLFPTQHERDDQMWNGTRRLLLLALPAPGRRITENLSRRETLALVAGPYETMDGWMADCMAASVDELMARAGGPVWTATGFARLRAEVRRGYAETVLRIGQESAAMIALSVDTHRGLDALDAPALRPAKLDMRAQLHRLVFDGCITEFGADRIPDVKRYLAAVAHRLSKLPNNVERDRGQMQRCTAIEAEIDAAAAEGADPAAVEEAVWLSEELRVGVFAQHLGTDGRVSEERIRRVLHRS